MSRPAAPADDPGEFYGADLAYIHHVGYGEFASAAATEFSTMLAAAGIRDGRVLDLGCGSGILARELSALGYDVVGVDTSARMLELARGVAPHASFLRGDIKAMAFPSCRAAFGIGEAFSYLPSSVTRVPSLRRPFAEVARALQPGGLFVFDLITVRGGPLMAYRTWQAGEDWAVLVDVREDRAARIVRRQITAFRRTGEGYRRSDERHAVAVYDRADVARWLAAAGLSVSVRRQYGRAALPPRRLAFIARRVAPRARREGSSR